MFISATCRWVVDPVLENVLDNIASAMIKSKTLTFLVVSWIHSKKIGMEVLLYIFVYSAFVILTFISYLNEHYPPHSVTSVYECVQVCTA